jgi:hypothetical protein
MKMAKSEIQHYGHVVGSVNLDASRISGTGGPDFPRLVFPMDVHVSPIDGQEIILIQLAGDLIIGEQTRVSPFISDYLLIRSSEDPKGRDASLTLGVPIDLWKIERIEEKRRGDIKITLEGKWFYVLHKKKSERDREHLDHEHLELEPYTTGFRLEFSVIRSLWVENILPGLGHGKIKILEIPYPEKTLEGVFEKAIQELEQARKYFNEGDYDKTVGHCRSAVQLIPELLPLSITAEGFAEKSKQFVKEHLRPLIEDSKTEAYSKVIKALWDLAAIPHHPSPPGYFNRADAEFSLLVTSASLGYVGKLLSSK